MKTIQQQIKELSQHSFTDVTPIQVLLTEAYELCQKLHEWYLSFDEEVRHVGFIVYELNTPLHRNHIAIPTTSLYMAIVEIQKAILAECLDGREEEHALCEAERQQAMGDEA